MPLLNSNPAGLNPSPEAAAGGQESAPGNAGADPHPAPPPGEGEGGDGPVLRRLDPRRIPLERTVNAISTAVVTMLHLVAIPIVWLTGAGGYWGGVLVVAAWPLLAIALIWLTIAWPPIDYRHWWYHVDEEGIEIGSGVIWRQHVAVPRSRVQHIDVSQGPIERSYGLATLSVYTAGTRYSKVDLPGLDYGVALSLRDALLPKDAEPAV